MAGEWIKMRVDLSDDPAVIAMAAKLAVSELTIVGGLHKLWSWADRHTTDGNARSVTTSWINRYIMLPDFAEAMIEAGWLTVGNGVSFPNFERHNGESGKKRAITNKRVSEHREMKRRCNDDSVTESVTREEKRRNKNNTVVARPDGISESVWDDFLKLREKKKAPFTETALKGIVREAAKAGYSVESALQTCCERGWQSFKADWVAGQPNGQPAWAGAI